MIRHIAFFEPATAYRRPLTLATSFGRAAFEHVAERDDELLRLIFEQQQDQQNDDADQVDLAGVDEGPKEDPTP